MKTSMPIWPIKIFAKLILGRIPNRHKLFRSIGMFKHGSMDNAQHALKIFNLHKNRCFENSPPKDFIALELGPGDSLICALLAKAYGSSKSYHVDVGSYALDNINKYKNMCMALENIGVKNLPNISHVKSMTELLGACNASYLTNGLDSLKLIPSNSVDFIWSHSVLEHIRKKDFLPTMIELHRVLKKSGFASHNVDLQDHLQKSLNNLRFPEWIWENDFFADSGFYTNRIRYFDSLEKMKKSGFKILMQESGKWQRLPIPKHKLHLEYRKLSEDELRIRTYSVILKK